jgi:hypothetical protein
MQKRAEPRRGAKPAKRIKRDVEKTWQEVRKIWALIDDACKAAVEARPKTRGEVTIDMPLTDAAMARLDQKKAPPAPFDPVVEGTMRGLFEYASWKHHMTTIDALANHWLAAGGAPLAIEALSEAPKWWWAFVDGMLAVRHNIRGDVGYLDMHIGPWQLVRAELATLDDDAYAKARNVAAKRFEEGDLGVKSSIAFAFPGETKWVDAAIDACFAHKSPRHPPRCMTPLLASVTDAKLAAKMVASAPWGVEWCPSLVEGIGVAAAPLLIRMEKSMEHVPEKRKVLESLALVHSAEVADHFATHVDDPALRAVVFQFFEAAPELARAALEPIAKKSGKGEAAKLLAHLKSKT